MLWQAYLSDNVYDGREQKSSNVGILFGTKNLRNMIIIPKNMHKMLNDIARIINCKLRVRLTFSNARDNRMLSNEIN